MTDSSSVKIISRSDGKARFEVFSRTDGLFYFEEHKFVKDDEYGNYFYPTHVSGLYPSKDDAINEAYAIIPWLKSEISN